jgi:hypothetical protein
MRSFRPRETRRKLITALNNLDNKRDKNPPEEARQHPALEPPAPRDFWIPTKSDDLGCHVTFLSVDIS